ncbi:hypothetical protein PTSG_07003 [Salpingoeca rosetta]|uniref:CYRIA/CYRIB Rac1 binding domain-containing protein n=1 Tax=Salpingoeca rosetta (strain ATCC 50818 / BSB-021) TaxID=946362 RepID=F2UDR6_SALR5|nr:uncharacterized protein PTSG_07003 [Salpingoeca rosetta]EGD74766.1 hypothetical protein PTSG_07003 [Salpingoeca rosetta]|eukprot:XP_004992411.1 hypothetical protein PTSG_07003 [Salpingoeca rosetta]
MEKATAQVDILRRDINLSDDQETLTPERVPAGTSHCTADPALQDAAIFSSVDPNMAHQAKLASSLASYVKKAEQYLYVLYAARSLSKAIPQLQSNNQPNKEKLYEESIRILQPEVDRMKYFLIFQEEAIQLVSEVIAFLAETYVKGKRETALIPDGVTSNLISLFGMLFTVDNLKNVKSAWSNDLSAYKRACSNLRRMDGINIQEQQKLIFFLGASRSQQTPLEAGNSTAYDLALKALRTVANWTLAILEQAAWKYAHPTDEYINRECPAGCTPYEKAVRYNYSRTERLAMIEVLAMIKDVQGQLDSMASLLVPEINTFIHHQVQAVVHGVFQPLLQHANKKKRREASRVLPGLVNMVSDLEVSLSAAAAAAHHQVHVPATKRDAKKMTRQAIIPDAAIALPVRKCGPTSTQLFYLQAALTQILHFESGGLLKAKDLSPQQTDALKSLMAQMLDFHDMLNFHRTLEQCTDLSSLWYKEFHLELAKEIQFPVEFSLPWILTTTGMTERGLHEHTLIPLELYNAAAQHALFKLKSQTLYNEIEAEVNLCFDQLMFHIGEQVFVNFKAKATSIMLAREAKESSVLQSHASSLDAYETSFHGLLNQRHVRLLGRSIDVNNLIEQGLDALMKRSIGMAIQVFEAEDIRSIVAFERALEIERLAHKFMSEHFSLTPFEDMLEEQNGSVNPASNHGRIEHKIIFELLSDLTANFAFDSATNEFFRPALVFADQQERDPATKISNVHMFGSKALAHAMQTLLDTTKRTFRVEHAAAVVRLVKPHNMGALINELSQTVGLALHTVVRPFVAELVKALFGEGLHWGGLMLVYLLGQRQAFDAFHYLQSWLNIVETGVVATTTSGNAASVGPIDLDEFASLAKKQCRLNTKIIDLFRAHYPLPDDRSNGRAGFCRPPRDRRDQGSYVPCPRELSQPNADTETSV